MEDNKELIQHQTTEVALPSGIDNFLGYESFDSTQFVIPRMRIIQHMSRIIGATPGTLRLNQTNEEFKSLHVTVINAMQGRVLFKEDMQEAEPICRSDDGRKPSEAIEFPISSICVQPGLVKGRPGLVSVCAKSKWGPNRERPECAETRNLLCVGLDDMLPFWISFHGMSLKPVMGYISSLALARRPLWKYSTTISLKEIVDVKGKYFVAVFSPAQLLSEDMQAEMAGMVEMLASENIATTLEAEQEAAEAGAVDAAGGVDGVDGGVGTGSEAKVEKPAFMAGKKKE